MEIFWKDMGDGSLMLTVTEMPEAVTPTDHSRGAYSWMCIN